MEDVENLNFQASTLYLEDNMIQNLKKKTDKGIKKWRKQRSGK